MSFSKDSHTSIIHQSAFIFLLQDLMLFCMHASKISWFIHTTWVRKTCKWLFSYTYSRFWNYCCPICSFSWMPVILFSVFSASYFLKNTYVLLLFIFITIPVVLLYYFWGASARSVTCSIRHCASTQVFSDPGSKIIKSPCITSLSSKHLFSIICECN